MVLMRNNSQNAGCMRRSPASHCCQVRQVVCNRSAAAVCESPAASLAARTSSGVGFRAGLPARLRFGWLPTKRDLPALKVEQTIFFNGREVWVVRNFDVGDVKFGDVGGDPVFATGANLSGQLLNKSAGLVAGRFVVEGFDCDFKVFNGVHFWLQPLSPEARLWRIHTLNNTLIARNVKGFMKINSRGRIKPSNDQHNRQP